MGGRRSHEFMVVNHAGDVTLLRLALRLRANAETAHLHKGAGPSGEPAPIERVATPGVTTIDALAEYLGLSAAQTAKAVFFAGPAGELIFAVIRGDLEVNEAKLSTLLGGIELAPAGPALLAAAGIVAGYASPAAVGAARAAGVRVVADDSVSSGANLWPAQRGGHHCGTSTSRAFAADLWAISPWPARATAACTARNPPRVRGIEVGQSFNWHQVCDSWAHLP